MRRLWLFFAQAVTVCLAVVFVITTLRPDWVPPQGAQSVDSARPDTSAMPALDMGTGVPVQSYADAVARAAPSVVSVYTRKHIKGPQMPFAQAMPDFPAFGQHGQAISLGSGVIVRDDGYILTNYHVVKAADAIEVTLTDGRQTAAELIGADPESDLAVIRIALPDVTAIALGDDRVVSVGDVVLAIGNPFGVGQTTTLGIVSALGRNSMGVNIYENFIQTDAAINPGNSGGALVDTAGRLIGINTAIYSENGGSLGIGFAIPVQAAKTILTQIVDVGHVARGWLGVEPQDVTPELAGAFGLEQQDGVILASVLTDGPAAKAGLQVGDIVVLLNEHAVVDAVQFLGMVAALNPESTVSLQILRDGTKQEINVQLGARPPVTQPARTNQTAH